MWRWGNEDLDRDSRDKPGELYESIRHPIWDQSCFSIANREVDIGFDESNIALISICILRRFLWVTNYKLNKVDVLCL